MKQPKNADTVHHVTHGFVTTCGKRVDAVSTPRTTRYPALVTCVDCIGLFTPADQRLADPNVTEGELFQS